ncbi:type II toxin-antitoxin system VapC family toxin [Luteolibacter sp. Populi]|uniref:type II toxin-antitoxin system VapC family toxin n=1 Tax=Luteolibacter sp. Populi TaxID=3230487 RepID=UPI003465429C
MLIVDTGPLVALIDRSERQHGWAKACFGELRHALVTCDAVISETMFLVRRAGKDPSIALELITRNLIISDYRVQEEAAPLMELMQRYRNVPMSLADACLVRMAGIHDGARVLTMDSDFTVYRKFGRKVIPVIMPD